MDAASLVLGILSVFIWPVHWVSFCVSTIGLLSGVIALRKRKSGLAVTGIVLAGTGMVLLLVDLKFGLLDMLLKNYFQL